jgi:hypothetical protein
LVIHLLEITPEATRIASKWIKKNVKKEVPEGAKKHDTQLNDELLMKYWDNIQPIVSESGESDTYSRKNETALWHWINKITELAKTKQISREAKFMLMDELFSHYWQKKSRFGDIFIDTVFEICENTDEWEYFINKLEEKAGVTENSLIMDIYRYYLRNEDQYLKKRKKHLKTGADYLDLIAFFRKKKKVKKAVETAEKGITRATGILKELYEFLFTHYYYNKDMENLERISQMMIKQGSREPELLERLFNYYKKNEDYSRAKDILLRWHKSVRDSGQPGYNIKIKTHLIKMKEYLKESDWKMIEPEFLDHVKLDNLSHYLEICWEKGMKKEILEVMLTGLKTKGNRTVLILQCDEFAEKLKKEFPGEITRYYWKRAYLNIALGNRPAITRGINYLKKVEKIYVNILKDNKTWESRLGDLKKEFKGSGIFMEVVKKL